MAKKKELVAIAFGSGYPPEHGNGPGDLEGDSCWCATVNFPYKEGMTPTELYDATIERYHEAYCVPYHHDEDQNDCEGPLDWFRVEGDMFTGKHDHLAGWWIVPKSIAKIIRATADAMPPAGGDSMAYNQISTLKAIAKAGAIKTLKSRGLPAKYRKLVAESEYHRDEY